MSWVVTVVVGLVLGVTSYWHGRVGGAGTSGVALVVALAVVAVACAAAAVWTSRSR